jgi:hypothetical protein
MPRNYAYEPYGVGDKIYGSGRPHPTSGPVDKLGYRERDRKTKAKRNAMLRRLKAGNAKKYMNPDYLRGPHV